MLLWGAGGLLLGLLVQAVVSATGAHPDARAVLPACVLVALLARIARGLVGADETGLAPEAHWPSPTPPARGTATSLDPSTRRLVDVIAAATPPRASAPGELARRVNRVACQRLVAHHEADPDDPLATAEARHLLSPATLAWLRSADSPNPDPCPAQALRPRLTEVARL